MVKQVVATTRGDMIWFSNYIAGLIDSDKEFSKETTLSGLPNQRIAKSSSSGLTNVVSTAE